MSVVQPPGCLPAKVSFISSSSSFPFRIFSGDLFSFSPIINSFVLSFWICSLSFFQSRPVVVSTFMDLSLVRLCVYVCTITVHRDAILCHSPHRLGFRCCFNIGIYTQRPSTIFSDA
jgi:hypothetical protein